MATATSIGKTPSAEDLSEEELQAWRGLHGFTGWISGQGRA